MKYSQVFQRLFTSIYYNRWLHSASSLSSLCIELLITENEWFADVHVTEWYSWIEVCRVPEILHTLSQPLQQKLDVLCDVLIIIFLLLEVLQLLQHFALNHRQSILLFGLPLCCLLQKILSDNRRVREQMFNIINPTNISACDTSHVRMLNDGVYSIFNLVLKQLTETEQEKILLFEEYCCCWQFERGAN